MLPSTEADFLNREMNNSHMNQTKLLSELACRFVLTLGISALCVLSSPKSSAAIVDGGFETPVLSSGEARLFGTGSTIGNVWTVLGPPGYVDSVLMLQYNVSEPYNGVNPFSAQEGLNSLDLSGVGNLGLQCGVEQIIPTAIGESYLLSFYVGRASGGAVYATASTVDVRVNGGSRMPFTNGNSTSGTINWQQFSTAFVATSTSTTLSFFNGQTTNNFSGLDNVVVIVVPEPTTTCLFCLAIGFLGFQRHRARSA